MPAITLAVLATLLGPAWAGRPESVDDANVDDKGTGHVEVWFAREATKSNIWHVAPAFSPWQSVEFSAVLARDRTNSITVTTALARLRLTEPQRSGCNVLAAIGHQHASPGGNTPSIYTAVTCNQQPFALHLNVGAAKTSGSSGYGSWGIALEQDTGDFVEHVEAFGREHAKPTFQLGARKALTKAWQLDGTLGRTAGETIFSLGAKLQF